MMTGTKRYMKKKQHKRQRLNAKQEEKSLKKTVIINGIECKLKSSAAIPKMYRMMFHRDIFVDMTKIEKDMKKQERTKKELKAAGEKNEEMEFESTLPIDSLEMFENIAYLMHKHGDPSQPDNIDDWLEQFEMFDIYEILPEIIDLWHLENEQMSDAKKKNMSQIEKSIPHCSC